MLACWLIPQREILKEKVLNNKNINTTHGLKLDPWELTVAGPWIHGKMAKWKECRQARSKEARGGILLHFLFCPGYP